MLTSGRSHRCAHVRAILAPRRGRSSPPSFSGTMGPGGSSRPSGSCSGPRRPPRLPQTGAPSMRAAIYARVSTARQNRDQTIDSQLAALRQWADGRGHHLRPEHGFTDHGYSGTRLDRPALDRLRDAAREGEIDVVAVDSPDRLARTYAYQVLLLEGLRQAGCEVAFVERPIP